MTIRKAFSALAASLAATPLFGALAQPLFPYVAPSTGPRAEVLVASRQELPLGLTYFQRAEDCGLPIPFNTGFKEQRLVIKANEDASFLVGTGLMRTCNIYFTFPVRDARTYRIDLFVNEEKTKCFIEVFESESPDAGNSLMVGVKQREENITARGPKGAFCTPK